MNSESSYESSIYETDSNLSSRSNTESSDDNKYNLHYLKGDILNKYNIIEEIGRGGYSIVWLGYNINDSKYYAIKVQNSDDFEEGVDEIRILKKLNHKNINKLVDYFIEERYDDNNILRKYICSVYELCCGNLDTLARKGKFKNGYPSSIVKKFYNQIIDGLNYLHHNLKVFHGDIKPDNILLVGFNNRDKMIINYYDNCKFQEMYSKIKKEYFISKGKNIKNIKKMDKATRLKIRASLHKKIVEGMDSLNLKETDKYLCDDIYFNDPHVIITDFGNYCPDDEVFNESFGTLYYQAPEIILQSNCTKKVDIWALGCTLYEFLCGKILFNPQSNKNQDLEDNLLELFINYCGLFSKEFLRGCERRLDYFDKKFNLKNRTNYKVGNIKEYLYMNLDHIEDSEYWITIISQMLQLIPSKRVKVKELSLK
jgi:serine/threonine protein kinase